MQTQEPLIPTPAWRSPWVIAWVTGVLVVLGANLFMVYKAFDTSPGLVVQDYYDRGQHYEKTLVSRMAKDPGWDMKLDLAEQWVKDQPKAVYFRVRDKSGIAVSAEQVVFFAYRPSDVKRDFSVPMDSVGSGVYRAEVSFPLKGTWDLMVSVRQGGEEFHHGQRILVAE
jgi:nitrogen fixation protein FixH